MGGGQERECGAGRDGEPGGRENEETWIDGREGDGEKGGEKDGDQTWDELLVGEGKAEKERTGRGVAGL